MFTIRIRYDEAYSVFDRNFPSTAGESKRKSSHSRERKLNGTAFRIFVWKSRFPQTGIH